MLAWCTISFNLICNMATSRIKILTFVLTQGFKGRCKTDRGLGKNLITVMLIYRHWVILAYSEKLSDLIVFRNVKFIPQEANIAFALA